MKGNKFSFDSGFKRTDFSTPLLWFAFSNVATLAPLIKLDSPKLSKEIGNFYSHLYLSLSGFYQGGQQTDKTDTRSLSCCVGVISSIWSVYLVDIPTSIRHTDRRNNIWEKYQVYGYQRDEFLNID